MDAAIALYRRLGFREAAPYGELAIEDVLHMELSIPRTSTRMRSATAAMVAPR
jgi:hypothetical protein